MESISRRQAMALGTMSGVALLAAPGRAEVAEGKDVIFAGEKAVLFKLKSVTIDAADKVKRTVAVSFGKADARVKLAGLPLADDIRIRVSFVRPGVVNNLPFEWERLVGAGGSS